MAGDVALAGSLRTSLETRWPAKARIVPFGRAVAVQVARARAVVDDHDVAALRAPRTAGSSHLSMRRLTSARWFSASCDVRVREPAREPSSVGGPATSTKAIVAPVDVDLAQRAIEPDHAMDGQRIEILVGDHDTVSVRYACGDRTSWPSRPAPSAAAGSARAGERSRLGRSESSFARVRVQIAPGRRGWQTNQGARCRRRIRGG